MHTQNETVLLDTTNYNPNTHAWDVPILRLPGVSCVSLHIDQHEVPSNKFSVNRNVINLSEEFTVSEGTVGHLVVGVTPSNLLVTFWLPVILVAIGLVGTIGQPVLHGLGLLYAPELCYEVNPRSWGYDEAENKFEIQLALKPVRKERVIKESELGDWRLFLCVRQEDDSIDWREDEYCFLGGPFTLGTLMEHSVKTDAVLSRELLESKGIAQCCIVLIHKSLAVTDKLRPSAFGKNLVRVLGAVGVKVDGSR